MVQVNRAKKEDRTVPSKGESGWSLKKAKKFLADNKDVIGAGLTIFGGAAKAVGEYQDASATADEMLIRAINFAHLKEVSGINFRKAIDDTERILIAGKQEVSHKTLAAGRSKASFMTQLAAGGHTLGIGSAAELAASMDLIKEMDAITISTNFVRQAQDMQFKKQTLLLEEQAHATSAESYRKAAARISPTVAAGTSLLGTAAKAIDKLT